MLKLATCTVSYEGYHDLDTTEKRLNILENVVKIIRQNEINLICLPGGYLYTTSENNIKTISEKLAEISQKYNTTIITGIDTKTTNTDIDNLIKEGKLYSFAIYSNYQHDFVFWRQRSSTNKNQKYICDDLCNEMRTIHVGNKSIEILICGEIFNHRIRESAIKRKVNAVVDIAHRGDKFRIDGAMKIFAKKGIPCFCSVHVKKINAVKRAYFSKNNGWVKRSTHCTDILIKDNPRIEIKTWII